MSTPGLAFHDVLVMAAIALAVMGLGQAEGVPGRRAPRGSNEVGWAWANSLELPGLKVSLSAPVLVGRSRGYLWFPTLVTLADGELLALMSDYADIHTTSSTSMVSFSGDGGLTWTEPVPALYGDSHLRLPSGDDLLLPYYLRPRAEGGMTGPYQIVLRGQQRLQVVESGVTVTGWPKPDRSFAPDLGLSGFVFNGQVVTLKDGRHLATLYGYFQGDARYSLVSAESADGVQWTVRSIIAGSDCALAGSEGPCEAALCRLADGRLLCVFRLESGLPFGQTWSNDEGMTWSEPVAMAGPYSVQPALAVLKDGMVALSGGRPGILLWLNPDGSGTDWLPVDVCAHHNACVPHEQITSSSTSSYTEVVAVGDNELLLIYDRVPHGWEAIPDGSPETNSVWVVRVRVEREGQ